MFARVMTFTSPLPKLDDGSRYFQEQAVPSIQDRLGFAGAYWMLDRESGRVIGITLWESEEALRASDQQHQSDQVRARRDEAIGAAGGDTSIMEVAVHV